MEEEVFVFYILSGGLFFNSDGVTTSLVLTKVISVGRFMLSNNKLL